MSKYIDADVFKEKLRSRHKAGIIGRKVLICEFKAINEMPSVDVVEVKHGKWKAEKTKFGFCFYCSQCEMLSYWAANFCPHCGADMRGKYNET